jgi:hypothetical protein
MVRGIGDRSDDRERKPVPFRDAGGDMGFHIHGEGAGCGVEGLLPSDACDDRIAARDRT